MTRLKASVFFANVKEDAWEYFNKEILGNVNFPFGIFCNSDEMLVEIYKSLNNAGVQIPNQVSLSCISEGVTPKILKIEIPYIDHGGYNVGWEASQLLLNKLNKLGPLATNDRIVSTKAIL